jgi:uncharacterized protein
MQQNPIGWFEIYVNDMARAKKFYQAVLDIQLEPLEKPPGMELEMWCFAGDMESYGATGSLVKVPGFAAGNNSIIVYFACQDCAVEESRVVANGGKVQTSKMAIGQYGFISLAIDTEGNIIGLHSKQ